ncbi:MAG: NAD(P)H-dependent flavin oxidoreductase [Acidobacteriota bacterium]
MRTRITGLFGITHPIVLSGMSWVSVPELVAAVSNAGGLGILATGVFNAKQTREAVHRVRELTDRPFGANATLYFPGARENANVLLEEEVPVINFSMGKGDWIVRAAHAYGGRVVATVTNRAHAVAAAAYGTDALIVTGHEAAAHGGDVTSLVLVPRIVDAVPIPVIAAGGFADGRGLAAALALGAEGIAMGTRFMSTAESPVHEVMKRLAREADEHATTYSSRFDGQPCRVMRTRASRRAIRRGLDLKRAAFNGREIARMLEVPYPKLALGVLASGWKNARQLAHMANAFKAFRLAAVNGDNERGVLPLGQVTALVEDAPPVAEVIARIVAQAERIQQAQAARVASAPASAGAQELAGRR